MIVVQSAEVEGGEYGSCVSSMMELGLVRRMMLGLSSMSRLSTYGESGRTKGEAGESSFGEVVSDRI